MSKRDEKIHVFEKMVIPYLSFQCGGLTKLSGALTDSDFSDYIDIKLPDLPYNMKAITSTVPKNGLH